MTKPIGAILRERGFNIEQSLSIESEYEMRRPWCIYFGRHSRKQVMGRYSTRGDAIAAFLAEWDHPESTLRGLKPK